MADDVYRMDLTAEEIEESLIDMASHSSEAWAIGERKGVPVGSTDVTYQNNAKYYAEQAATLISGDVTEAVRWDIPQTLTSAQQTQARGNIGAASQNDYDVLDARVDQIASLPAGSTSGDAELMDIRVGYDGYTWSTAGDAVRGQVANLKSELNDKVDKDGIGQVAGENISTSNVISNSYNALEEIGTITVGGWVDGYDISTNEPVIKNTNPNTNLVYIPLDGTESTIVIPFGTASNIYYGRVLTFVNSSNKRIVFFTYAHLSSNADLTPYLSIDNGIYTFNIAGFKSANKTWDTGYSSSQATGLYIAYPKNATALTVNKSSVYSVNIEDIEWLNTDSLKPLDVVLPSNIYGVAGQQINIYKENLCLHNRLRTIPYIHTRIANSYQSDDRTIWTPTATGLTSIARDWEIFRNGLLEPETKEVVFNEVPKDTGSGSIKVLVIGDSKVAAGFVTNYFRESFNDDAMTCTLLGTQYTWSSANAHEGYTGKTAKWFCTNASSPFSHNGAFDFANYLSTNNISTPDFVFINLGTNDCAESATAYKTDFPTYINQMITSIHSVSASINVIVGLCEGVATTQDENNAEFLNWDLNEKISDLHRISIAEWDNRQNEHLYVCPMYMGMDLRNDYNMTEVPLSSWDEKRSTGKTRYYITDTVHQSGVGYGKNADYMYALVKYITAKSLA